jgi:hypothetical protein
LFDDGTDERGVEGLDGGGFVGEGEEIGRNSHGDGNWKIENRKSKIEKKKQSLVRLTAGQAGAQQCCARTRMKRSRRY